MENTRERIGKTQLSDTKQWKQQYEGFHELPQKVLIQIFSYCSEREIGNSLSHVCSNWLVASRDPSLRKKLEFQGKHLQISTICRTLYRAPHLRNVSFIHVPEVSTAIRQLCRCNKEVQRVTIRHCTSKNECITEPTLRNLVISCPRLQVLDLKGTQFHAHWLYQELHQLRDLFHLNISMNKYLRIQDLLMIVHNCHTLSELSMFQWKSQTTQANITDQDAVLMFSLLQKQIISLKFDMQGLGPPAFKAILECTKLECLGLNNAFQMPAQLFCSIGIKLPDLNKLTLHQARHISADDFFNLLSTPGLHLTKLDLFGCWQIDDKGLEALANTCYETLQHLSIKCCKLITENGIGYILNSCPHLCYLNAAYIGQLGLELLDIIPHHLPDLKMLVMDQKVEEQHKILFHISSRLPHLRILQSTSEFMKAEHPYIPVPH